MRLSLFRDEMIGFRTQFTGRARLFVYKNSGDGVRFRASHW